MNSKELEKLVGQRFTEQELEEKLHAKLYKPNHSHEYITGEDYKLTFGVYEGVGTIWYAKTRAGNMYITEVDFDSTI